QSELGWLQCQELLESFDGAIRHLEQRIELGSDVWARRALSRLRLVQFDVMRRNTDRYRKTSFVAAFDVLMAASDSMPDHRSVIERLLRLLDSLPRAASADSIAVGDITQRLRTPHQMLVAASVLNDRGYLNQAIEVLRIAHGRQPDNPATLNNLAWYLATAEPPQLDEASRLAQRLVQRFPGRLEFRETKGQIALKQGDFETARVDLESAEGVMPDHLPLHKSLKIVYEKLDLAEDLEKRIIIIDQMMRAAKDVPVGGSQ
ncbi:MAG: hypothetical protein AAFP69_13225, partial [Planctomycetota bacterium]